MSDQPGDGYLYRYNEAVKKLLNVKGGEALKEVGPELVFGVTLEDDREEFAFLLSTIKYSSGNVSFTALPANFTKFQFVNPAGSGVLATIIGGWFRPTGGASPYGIDIRVGATIEAPSSTVLGTALDTRAPQKSSACSVQSLQSATAISGVTAGQFDINNSAAPGNLDVPIPLLGLVVAPGGNVTFFTTAVNVAANLGALIWRERPIEDSEKK